MKRELQIFGLIVFLFAIANIGFGQDAGVIKVLDGKTREAVPFAHVCFEPLDDNNDKVHCVTDMEGKVQNKNNLRTIIAISAVGFETLYDTVNANESKDILLVPKIFDIDEVVITAQFAPEKADKSIYNVKVINAMQIESRGANNLTDILSGELNMRTSYDSQLGASLSLQGLSGEHVKYLIDGVPVIGRKDGDIDLNQINLYNVDHIEIIEGPMSVIYGSNAIAGVVNIITKENKTSTLQAHAGSYIESVGVYNFDAGASIRKKNHVISMSGGRNFFNGFFPTYVSPSQHWKPKRQYNVDGYYIYSNPKFKLKLSSLFFHEHIQDKNKSQAPYYETAFYKYYFTKRWTNKVEVTNKLKNNKFLSIVGAYSTYNWVKNTYLMDLTTLNKTLTTNIDDHDTTRMNSVLLRGTYSKDNKESWLNYQAGFDINVENMRGKRITNNSQEIGDYAGFVNLKAKVLKALEIQPGLRYSYNTKYTAPLIYSFNLKWDHENKYIFRASYAKGFRAPSLKELYLNFVDINHDIHGNENLTAEYSDNFNFSVTYNIEREKNLYGFETSLFHNDITNLIMLLPSEDITYYKYINFSEYITKGIRLYFNYKYYPRLNLKTGVSVIGSHYNLSDQNNKTKEFYYSPDVSLNLSYKFINRNIQVSLYYKYNGKLPVPYGDENEIEVYYESDYHTLDATIMKHFFNNRLNVSCGGKNLFDVTTLNVSRGGGGTHGSSAEPKLISWGRTFFIKLSYVFNKYN